MKTIIVEGGDRLGKNSLIKSLCEYYNYDNITVRHFGKPPKNIKDPLLYQSKCFLKEANLLNQIRDLEKDDYSYFENIVIYNRFIYGEYVYGQMFRDENKEELINYLYGFEQRHLMNENTFLILLTADPEFFLSKEDGQSFSKNLDQKTKELKLFNEIFDQSILTKMKLKVNLDDQYVPKSYVLSSVIDFLKYKNTL